MKYWSVIHLQFCAYGSWDSLFFNIIESQLQTYESKTLFLMTSLEYYCIPGLAEIKTYAQKMQDAQETKSLIGPSVFVLAAYVNTMVLTSERH